jgi:hypothetical protein
MLEQSPARTLGARTFCVWCGTPFRLQRLAQRFCSPKCQKTGRRAELAVGASRSRTLTHITPVGGFPIKNPSPISTLEGREARSSIPLNIVGGGLRWPSARHIDPKIVKSILRHEIGGELVSPLPVSKVLA